MVRGVSVRLHAYCDAQRLWESLLPASDVGSKGTGESNASRLLEAMYRLCAFGGNYPANRQEENGQWNEELREYFAERGVDVYAQTEAERSVCLRSRRS